MHLHVAGADAASVEIELHVGMVGEEAHGDGAVGDAFGDHQRGEALAEGVVVRAGVPDGDFLGLPRFLWADGDGLLGHHGDVASATGARILRQRDGVQVDDARGKLAVFLGRRRGVLPPALARQRVVECPVLDVALSALHDGAADALPAVAVGLHVGLGEMQVRVGHAQAAVDAVKTQLAVGLFKRQRMFHRNLLLAVVPLVHTPKMAGAHIEAQRVNEARDKRQLLRGADGAADAHGIVGRGLPPCFDVLQRLGQVKILQRVVHFHGEAGAREAFHLARRQLGGVADNVVVERGVVPPVGGDGAELAGHVRFLSRAPARISG